MNTNENFELHMHEPVIIGKSPAVREMKSFIAKAAASDSNVLILGETGVGKELAAWATYYGSQKMSHLRLRSMLDMPSDSGPSGAWRISN
jgi:transcriptional regulator with GAF, ATPase, and Fis domain